MSSVQRVTTFFFALSIFTIHPLIGQATGDVTFYGSIDPRPGSNGSCWGYVTPDGREYALLGANGGTSIIDINSLPLREVGFIPGPSSQWRELKTYSHYAYVVNDVVNPGVGVQIIDLSNPDSARLVRSFNYVSSGRNILQSHTITIADGYMYLSGSANWSPRGVLIFSLAVPDSPAYVGQFQPEYIHDCYVRNDTMYAAAIYSGGGMHIVNVTNKALPQAITKVTYAGSGTHNTWAAVNGRVAYTTDEIGNTTRNLKMWDISNLPQWRSAGQFTPRPGNTIHNVHGRGNYVYISHYGSWMIVADVHNDTIPVERGSYRTSSSGINWGVYPYFPSGKWISSDGSTGLFVCTFSGLLPRTHSPLLRPVHNAIVGGSSSTRFQWRSAANQYEDPHYYKLHVFGPGIDTLFRTNDTTAAITNLASFQNGQTYRWHVWIIDEYTQVSSRDTFQFLVLSNAARLVTNTDSLNFGVVPIDSTVTLPLVITNIGSGTLMIDSVRSTNSAFTTDFPALGGVAIQPDSTYTLLVSFTPSDSGVYQGVLQIFSNAYLQFEKDVALKGSGNRITTVEDFIEHPLSFKLHQNYPNPFNPITVIRYQLPVASKVTLKIYNVLGQEVARLVDEIQVSGFKSVEWSSINFASGVSSKGGYASGVYFYRLEATSIATPSRTFTQVNKMVLIR